jgi:hypothetical protein
MCHYSSALCRFRQNDLSPIEMFRGLCCAFGTRARGYDSVDDADDHGSDSCKIGKRTHFLRNQGAHLDQRRERHCAHANARILIPQGY